LGGVLFKSFGRSKNHISLLQKSPIKATIFCKRDFPSGDLGFSLVGKKKKKGKKEKIRMINIIGLFCRISSLL